MTLLKYSLQRMLDSIIQFTLHQIFNIEPITATAWYTTAGGMCFLQQTQILQCSHLIANGGTGTVEIQQVHQFLGTDRLGSPGELIYYRLKIAVWRFVSIWFTPF